MSLALASPGFDLRQARFCAGLYRDMGFNPLPSRPGAKRPALRKFSRLRDEGIPPRFLERWWTPNVQICLGVRWGLCVLDLDGSIAVQTWRTWAAVRGVPPTWAVQHDPAGGMHLWFSVPASIDSIPFKSVLWQLPHVKHASIELLGDRNLVMAPPSVHPTTGQPYRWLPGLGPGTLHNPAPLPLWLLDLIPARPVPEILLMPLARPTLAPVGRYDRSEVRDAIRDKLSLAVSWGLRLAGQGANDAGWISCRAVGRPDEHPSASFSPDSGSYWEPGKKVISLFDLGVLLGAYTDWASAVNDLGRRYHVREVRHAV
jgi:hypothetical protein